MKKVIFFAAFLFVMVCGLMANPVDMEKARLVADRYVRASGLYDKQQKENRVVDITTKTQYTQFYVFRIIGTRSGKGFILVSGDDCGRPVLAYSATSDFMTQEMPDHVADWLKAYELQLQEARQKGMKAPDYIRRQWDWLTDKSGLLHDNTTETAALVTTHWDQMPYYNNLCPMDNAQETRALTGCVATAMAQIMKYWERPVNGIGSHSYTHATYGMQSADFGSTNYSWNDMPVQLSSTSTAAEVEAVSLLMYHCGVAVDMNYSPSGSGAQTIGSRAGAATAENALRNYFDYSPSLYGVYKSDYSDNVWKQLLMAELDARRPMIYRGEGGMGGHCFICDGYDSDTNFHFNFGWSGSNDGFYALSAVGQGNYTFTTSQGAILGIQPANTTGASPQELVISHIDTAGAMLAWVDMNSPAATAFTVVCAPVAAFDTANSTFFRTSTQPRLQLTDLATATRYRVAVRAHCADTVSPWSTVLEFTTALAPQPLPLAVSFDGGIPAGWEQEQPNGTVTWRTSVGGHGGSPSAPLSGSTNAFLYSDSRGCVSRLLTPLMDITSAAGRGTLVAKMAFGHTQAQWDSDIDQLYVYYRTAPSEEWTLLTAYTQAISNWQRDTLLLPEPSATYQVAFEGRLHWGHGICVDDVAFFSERQEDPVAAATTPYSCSFGDDTENANWVLLNGTDTNRWVIGYAVNSGNNNMGALYVSSDEGLSNFYLTNEASTVFAYRDITLTAGQYAYSYDWYAMGETGRDYMRVALVPSTVTLTGGTLGAWSENTLPTGALAMDGGHWLSGVATWQTANDVVDVPLPSRGCSRTPTIRWNFVPCAATPAVWRHGARHSIPPVPTSRSRTATGSRMPPSALVPRCPPAGPASVPPVSPMWCRTIPMEAAVRCTSTTSSNMRCCLPLTLPTSAR